MDFRNLRQKLDMDTIRAKLPQLPPLSALPQIKLPKAIPKLKSRKIFRTSREDVNRNSPQKPNQPNPGMGSMNRLPPPIPSAGFVKHTPTRISTISSLMNEDSIGDGSTYRSAASVDDDFRITSYFSTSTNNTVRPISPMRASTIAADGRAVGIEDGKGQAKMSLSQRLQRSYKDLTEFRIKHIFTKKTIVRKDNIQVEHYVTHYEEDLMREAQELDRRDRAIAENYSFRFKESRQQTDHSNSVTPDDSPRSEPILSRSIGRSVGELSGDESGMEASPPPRKTGGIAATRFAKVRSAPLRQSSSEHSSEREDDHIITPKPNTSTVWTIQKQRKQQEEAKQQREINESTHEGEKAQESKTKLSYKERMRRFANYVSTEEESSVPKETGSKVTRESTKMLTKLKRLGKRNQNTQTEVPKQLKRKLPTSPHTSDEEQIAASTATLESPSNNAFNTFRQNFKRLQQSIKAKSQANGADESGDESAPQKPSGPSKVEKLSTRLRRFRSRDVSVEDLDAADDANTNNKSTQSPIRQAISHKLETWKKSLKKRANKPDDVQATDGDETSPEKGKEKISRQKCSDTLIKKLKHIRARKGTDAKDDVDENTDNETTGEETQKSKSRATKFNEARQRTLKKVNEKMQNMKFFHRSQERNGPKSVSNEQKYQSEEEEWDDSPKEEEAPITNLPPTITRRDFPRSREYSPDRESIEQMAFRSSSFSRAAWTTKPISSQSMESDIDPSELPRVLIHQDTSDSFESTLIIAVTRPKISSSTPIITEITAEPPRTIQQDWVSSKKIIGDFKQATPPRNRRKQSTESIPSLGGHKRKPSMDSSSNSDSDSWMPENKGSKTTSRRTSQAGLVSIDEKSEAWKVKASATVADNQPLYKTKSIDIFEENTLKGGVLTAFEDFDEALRNEPVLKIKAERNTNSCDRESSEDTADDDNSSRITKISVSHLKEGSSDRVVAPFSTKENQEPIPKTILLQYGNSRESLIANFDENEENFSNNDDEEYHDGGDSSDDDRPPSAAPSPPPNMSPPAPPLPQRQPSTLGTKKMTVTPPPLPKSKPPPLPPQSGAKNQEVPPRIPERTSSMARAPKPLVKTSSLRLVYSEQVKPADVGKVNKLISKFEPLEGNTAQRPRVISRRMPQDDSEDYSDNEEDYTAMANKFKERYANIKIERDTTPTPTNTPKKSPDKSFIPTEIMEPPIRIKRELIVPMVVTTTDEDNNVQILTQPVEMRQDHDLSTDKNSNNSRPNSEYGSPLEYPSSLRSSLETIPILEHRDGNGQRSRNFDRHSGRSRRSMTRENDNYYSFDSDEENSYYSISSTGSNRYIVEL